MQSHAVPPLITRVEIGAFLAAAAVVVAMMTVPLPGDPLDYLDASEKLWSSELFHGTTRIGITIPVWLMTLVFGYSEVSLYTLPILGSAALAAITTMLGRILFNSWVGIAAAITTITSPWTLPYATQLLPDIGSAALVTLALVLVVSAAPERVDDTSRVWTAGVSLGLAYLIKETSLLFLPALLTVMVILEVPKLWRVLAGSAAVASVEALFGMLIWRDPLARINSLLLRSSTSASPERTAANEAAFAVQSNPVESFTVFIQLLWSNPQSRLVLMLGIILVLGAIFTRSRRYLALIAWIVIPWILLACIASIRPESGRPVIRLMLDRYWVGFLPPLAVGGFGALSMAAGELQRRSVRRFAVWGTAALCIAIGALGVWASVDSRSNWFVLLGNDSYWELRGSLASLEDEPVIYVDENVENLIRLYANDPVGRPLFVGTLASNPAALEDGSSLMLIDFEYSTAGAVGLLPVTDHYVYDAATDLRWAILARSAQIDRRQPMQESRLGEISADSWQMRLIDDTGSWGEPQRQSSEAVRLDSGEMVVFYDDRGPYRRPPGDSDLRVEPDRVAVVRIELDSEPVGVRAICDFYPVDGRMSGTRVRASALHLEGAGKDGVFALCRSPGNGIAYDLRPVIVVTGEGEVSVGQAEIGTVEAATPSGG